MTGKFTAEALETLALAVRADLHDTDDRCSDWAGAPHRGRLKQTLLDLRGEDPGRLAAAIIACYGDPATDSPGRLAHRGRACHWWQPAPSRPAHATFRADSLPPRGQSTPEARTRAKQLAAQAIRPKEHASA